MKKESAFKKILKIAITDKKAFVGLIISSILCTATDLAYPLLNQFAINKYIIEGNSKYLIFICFYFGFSLIYALMTYLFIYFANKIEINCAYVLRKESFYNLQTLSFNYFDKTPQGVIMSCLTSDSRKVSLILSWGFVDLLWGLLTMIGILFVLFIKNYLLALIIICATPILLLYTILMRKVILNNHRKVRALNANVIAKYNETFLGLRTIKSLSVEEKMKVDFDTLTKTYKKKALKAAFFSSLFGPVVFLLGYLILSGTLFTGSFMVLNNITIFNVVLSTTTLYVFMDYTIKFFDPVINISRIIGDFQQAQAASERVINLIKEIPSVKDSYDVVEKYGTIYEPKLENFEEFNGNIEFKNVCFSYNESKVVLDNFNLSVKQGMSVALVGHTGCGKSTIVNLLCRFYEPTSGNILVDGTDYKKRSISWLHNNLGYVLQTPQLFSDTILNNILYGNFNATKDDVIEVCKKFGCHEFIMKLKDGYESYIGEGGSKLSNGQKQLISICRAIIKDPKILVLDEATSSVDTEIEMQIKKAIDILLENRTTFIIAHRLSTIKSCDLILVLKDGKIIEQGKHEELLNNKGYYYSLYNEEFEKEIVNSI